MVPVVQAVTIAKFGPVIPYLIDRWPEIMLMMLAGTKNGEILRGPRLEPTSSGSASMVLNATDSRADCDAVAMRVRFVDFDAASPDSPVLPAAMP